MSLLGSLPQDCGIRNGSPLVCWMARYSHTSRLAKRTGPGFDRRPPVPSDFGSELPASLLNGEGSSYEQRDSHAVAFGEVTASWVQRLLARNLDPLVFTLGSVPMLLTGALSGS